jgi:hypothetical protein
MGRRNAGMRPASNGHRRTNAGEIAMNQVANTGGSGLKLGASIIGIAVVVGSIAAALYLGMLWLIAVGIMVALGLLMGFVVRKEV